MKGRDFYSFCYVGDESIELQKDIYINEPAPTKSRSNKKRLKLHFPGPD